MLRKQAARGNQPGAGATHESLPAAHDVNAPPEGESCINTALTDAQDAADSATVTAADVELAAGAKTVPAEQLWRELGLDDQADT